MQSLEPNIHKIAVLRANALGDFIFALPALTALRNAYPQAEIVLLARSWHRSFLENRPSPIDRVIVIPEGGIGQECEVGQDPIELEHFFAAMRSERFDLAIQLHGGGRNSNPFTLQLNSRLTIGLRTPDAARLDRWIPYVYYQSEILRYLEVVSLVGATPVELEPRLCVTDADLQESYQAVPNSTVPLIALHPGASAVERRWSPEKFAIVGDRLSEAGIQILITGTESEREVVEAVVDRMTHPAKNFCGQLSLNELTGLLSRCKLVISNDSGPLHLAAAVGTATIGLYWCGNLITAGLPMRSRHRPQVSWRLECPICRTNCMEQPHCTHAVSYIDDISTEVVLNSAFDLLKLE